MAFQVTCRRDAVKVVKAMHFALNYLMPQPAIIKAKKLLKVLEMENEKTEVDPLFNVGSWCFIGFANS